MSNRELKVGDIVRLRSDERKLTVCALSRASEHVKCVYWDDTGVLRESRWLDAKMLYVEPVTPR